MQQRPMPLSEQLALTRSLLADVRVATLATLSPEGPFASLTPFAFDGESGGLYLHISRMARHTRNLEADPRLSLLIAAPDTPDRNPQALPRVTFTGKAAALAPDGEPFAHARACYLARFPAAEMTFALPDFFLFSLIPARIRLVAGFGKAFSLAPEQLRQT